MSSHDLSKVLQKQMTLLQKQFFCQEKKVIGDSFFCFFFLRGIQGSVVIGVGSRKISHWWQFFWGLRGQLQLGLGAGAGSNRGKGGGCSEKLTGPTAVQVGGGGEDGGGGEGGG